MALATPTVYIPTLNGGERLAACLSALESQSMDAEVVVADNGPGQGSSSLLASRFPRVKRIGFDGRNLGFGTAVNRAVAAHGDGPVILLNDDAVPDPGFVENLVRAWDGGAVGMAAAVLFKSHEPDRIDSAGIACDETLMAWDYLTGRPVREAETAPAPLGPTGGGALYGRKAFEAAGGFDERIFLYYEDLDLALRLRLAGHDCRLVPAARASHESSATLGRRAAAKYRQTGFSRGYLLRKYGIMDNPPTAARILLSDTSACLAQLLLDQTAAGVRGRIEGWRTGRNLTATRIPSGLVEPAGLRRQFAIRVRRRRH